jgi:hypothetical protein
MDSTIYFEIFVLVNILLGDDIVGRVAGTAAKIASRPLQVRKFGQQVMRGAAFQPLQQPADRHLRR